MPLAGFEELHRAADERREPVRVAAAGGDDPTVLEALDQASRRGWVLPTVVGPEAAIQETAERHGVALEGFRIVPAEPDDAARAAVTEVREGRAAMLMKGRIATPALLRAVLHPEHGLRTGRVIGQVVLMEIMPAGRRFLLTDTGIGIQPRLADRADLLLGASAIARALGAETPRVAVMAASETLNPAMPETIDAAELQRRNGEGEFPGCVVEGPLSFDLAYAADAADKKRVGGSVAGAADVMLFPNLLAANLTVKAIMYTAECRFGGILCGTTAPVVFMSRADTTPTRLNSLALALAVLDRLTPPGR